MAPAPPHLYYSHRGQHRADPRPVTRFHRHRPLPPLAQLLRRFTHNRLALLGLIVLMVFIAACFFSLPWTTGSANTTAAKGAGQSVPRYADQMNLEHVKDPPNRIFWMGTDSLGPRPAAHFPPRRRLSPLHWPRQRPDRRDHRHRRGPRRRLVRRPHRRHPDAHRRSALLPHLPYHRCVILMRVAPGSRASPPSSFIPTPRTNRGFGSPATGAAQWANMLGAPDLALAASVGSTLDTASCCAPGHEPARTTACQSRPRFLGFGRRRIIARHILPNLVGTIVVYGAPDRPGRHPQ